MDKPQAKDLVAIEPSRLKKEKRRTGEGIGSIIEACFM
jgi:hypothetical protein